MRADRAEVQVLLDVPLTFQVTSRSIHCPMVDAAVGSTDTKLIVDTGATAHVLTIEFADRASLAYQSAAPGTDIAGALVPSWFVGEVDLRLGGTTVGLADVVAIDGPAPFADWGVGGFLSPQRLWPDATVVLELMTERLLVLDGPAEAIRDHLRTRFGACDPIDVLRQSAGTLAVMASILPFAPVVALLDSGAGGTEFAVDAVPGLVGPAGVGGRGVSGEAIVATEILDQVITFGDRRRRLPVLFVRASIPPPEGGKPAEFPHALLGMDCMRSSALVIGPAPSGEVKWFVPAARDDPGNLSQSP